jgi:hypothetical protein
MTLDEEMLTIDTTLHNVFPPEKLAKINKDDLERFLSMLRHHCDILSKEITHRLYPWAIGDPHGGAHTPTDKRMIIR